LNIPVEWILLVLYVLFLVGIGGYVATLTRNTREDYFLAGRGLGSLAIFMALFASNITAFTIIGHAGLAYEMGYGAFGYVIGWSIFITPFTYYLVGYRSWLLGKRYGYATQPQVFGGILNSRAVSLTFLVLLLFYTLPYMVLSIRGGAITFYTVTGEAVSFEVAAAFIVGISLLYTIPAGLRGTVWTDVFQGIFFLVVVVLILFAVGVELGGFSAITQRLLEEDPVLMERSQSFSTIDWFSYSFKNSLAVIVFPQMFIRILATRNSVVMQKATVFYPLALALVFGVSTLLGVWGSIAIPGLGADEASYIVPALISEHLAPLWAALGLVVILSVIKSSVDSQLLSVSHMVTDDFLSRYIKISSRQAVLWGRVFLVIFSGIAYYIALIEPAAIMAVAEYAFSGFSIMLPVMITALYWPRANKYGVCAALIVPAVMLQLWVVGWLPSWTTFGFMPVVPAFFLAALLVVVVSLLTPEPPASQREKTFGLFRKTFNGVRLH